MRVLLEESMHTVARGNFLRAIFRICTARLLFAALTLITESRTRLQYAEPDYGDLDSLTILIQLRFEAVRI